MREGRIRLVLVALLCSVLLSSCSFVPTGGTEELLVAPYLNDRQARVHEALTSIVSLSGIQYKYPLSGEYRSPFIFYDLDGDGRQEAIVFYSELDGDVNAQGSSVIRAKVLRELENGDWTTAWDIAGTGEQVDFIDFASPLEQNSTCILIGWQGTRRSATLGVYSFHDGVVREEVFAGYNEYYIDDFNGDGLVEILIVSDENSDDRFQLQLYGRGVGGRLEQLDTFWMAENATNVLQLMRGRLWNGTWALYIDELLDGSIVATEVVQVAAGRLRPLVSENEGEELSNTFREDDLYLCTDLLGDGVVEIPLLFSLPWQEGSAEISEVMLAQYMQLRQEGLIAVAHAVVNWEDGYRVFFPDRWLDTVTVVRPFENSEWQFFSLDEETGQPAEELLRIRAHSVRDYMDKFTEDYVLLADNGPLEYYGWIPETVHEDNALAITRQELESMFALLV